MLVFGGPQFINWNYTYVCNFNCEHCYSRAPSYPEELTTADYLRVADQIVECQVFKVALGGGEVLLREDCFDILAKLGDSGVSTMLTTNGWRVDHKVARRLADANLGTLYVSLDSPRAADHDRFRARRGSYERVIRALRAAVGANLVVYLSTVLTAMNVEDIAEFVEIAEREGLAGINFKRFRASGNGLANKDRYQLADSENCRIEIDISRLKRQSTLDISLNFGPEASDVDSGCSCGISALALRPNGDVSPCVYGTSVIGNLMRESLSAIWRHSPELAAMRAAGGCRAMSDHVFPSNPYLVSSDHHSEVRTRGIERV
jgi:MoaA/NifB/PqqE/SkfB family radical SAM enzyme